MRSLQRSWQRRIAQGLAIPRPKMQGLAGWVPGSAAWLAMPTLRLQQRQLRLVETLALGGKRQLMLVTCAGERFLVGGGLESVETIVRLKDQVLPLDEAAKSLDGACQYAFGSRWLALVDGWIDGALFGPCSDKAPRMMAELWRIRCFGDDDDRSQFRTRARNFQSRARMAQRSMLQGRTRGVAPRIQAERRETIRLRRSLQGSKSVPWSIVVGLTLLTLLPALLLSMTPLVRLLVVFHFLRQALGTQTAPSNQVLMGLALMMTWFLMQPVLLQVEQTGGRSVSGGDDHRARRRWIGASQPVKQYMLRYAREKDLAVFASAGMTARPAT